MEIITHLADGRLRKPAWKECADARPDPSAAAGGQAQSSNSDQTSSFEESLAALGDTVMRAVVGGARALRFDRRL